MNLNYTPIYFDLEIVTTETVEQQLKEQLELDDFNNEHFRYSSLINFVHSGKINLSNYEKLIDLLLGETDQLMVVGVFEKIIFQFNMHTEIHERFVMVYKNNYPSYFKNIENEYSLRKILHDNKALNEIHFTNFLADENMHRLLIENTTNIDWLQQILNASTRKKTKNVAMEKIKKIENGSFNL